MNEQKKPAAPPTIGAPGGAKLPSSQMTWQQQLMIWALIIIVGVLFGMGSTFDVMLKRSAKVWGDVPEIEVAKRASVANKLQAAIPERRFVENDSVGYAVEIWKAQLAAREGLEPKGKVLDHLVEDFLNKRLRDNRTYFQALEEHKGTDREITLSELQRYLAESFSVQAFISRSTASPAVPRAVVDAAWSNQHDRVEVDQVVLTAKPLLAEVMPADDDPEIDRTYDKHKDRFIKPANRTLNVAVAEVKVLAAKIEVSEDEAKKYYDEHKSEFPKPPVAKDEKKEGEDKKDDEKKPEEPQVRDFSEVKDQIVEKLKNERAEKQARDSIVAFEAKVGDLGLEEKNADAFTAAAKEAGLDVKNITVEEPKGATLEFGDLGTLQQNESQIGLFAKEEKFISNVCQTLPPNQSFLVFRLDAKSEAGARDLSDPGVKDEVKTILAGEKAYQKLLDQAKEIQEAAQAKGIGGLRAYFDEEKSKFWDVKVDSPSQPPLSNVTPAPTEPGGAAGEGKPLISLASADAPVFVASADETKDGLPSVKLMQFKSYKVGDPPKPEERERMADSFRSYAIQQHRYTLFMNELRKEASQ